ncbi:non-canonical purine NTP pyrophosphatase, partial [Escherichia coli]|uniref:non-canonical purine NTP pyrophosphatase n=1 Tax=Escherichia coli TaxID=562 RepID=UPI0024BCCBC4
YSARYADGRGDAANNAKLLEAMKDVPDAERGAQFVSVLALVRHADDPLPILCEGIWEGRILREARGAHGFGYDPLFWVPERDCSSAELAPEEKNRLMLEKKKKLRIAQKTVSMIGDTQRNMY